VWLSRVPTWLWEVLSNLHDDEEVEIGTLTTWTEGGAQKTKLALHDLPRFTELPKEYKLNTLNATPGNTFVFTEQDHGYYPVKYVHPGWYRARPRADSAASGGHRGGKRPPITKNTVLAARASHDVSLTPIETGKADASLFLLRQTARAQQARKQRLVLEPNIQALSSIIGGAANPATKAAIKTNMLNATKSARSTKTCDKYARIPQEDLLDLLAAMFAQYRYWSFDALQERAKQPERYLRETLALVAVRVNAGPCAGTWMLKEQVEGAREAMAPEPESDEDEDTDWSFNEDEDDEE
ncbi:uncharacterized protein K452DRAFT_216506, partial [Aplosporella prunicola CBS 121167]